LSVWTHEFRLTSSRQVVWFRWAHSLNPSASAASLQPLQLLSCWWVWHIFICVCCNFYWWHRQINHI
jgi:hypothetical protein